MKMKPERNRQIEPLCKFGPGGDFVAAWQPEPLEISEMSNRFVRLLQSVFEVFVVLLEKGSGTFSAKHSSGGSGKTILTPFLPLPDDLVVFDREKVIHDAEIRRIGDKAHAKAIAALENGRAFAREPMLFPDLGGNGGRARHKSKHRIRAYRRVAKKGSALRFGEQGSLFEGQFRSAKTA
jgi:hypothetical protein